MGFFEFFFDIRNRKSKDEKGKRKGESVEVGSLGLHTGHSFFYFLFV